MSFAESLKGHLAKLGRAAGLGPLAKLAVDGEKATLAKLETVARKAGISEAQIRKARRMKTEIDKKSFLVALLFLAPNPELIRAIAAEDETSPKAPKPRPSTTKPSARFRALRRGKGR
jgi:hypothetical protein